MKKLLILGAGYGGLAVAQRLDALARGKSQWEVTLLDQRDYHLIQVRVHEVAANSIPAEKVKVPFSELLEGNKVTLVQAQAERIEPQAKRVHTSTGILDYDQLVIALGSVTDYHNIPGLEEFAFGMKTLEDAIDYRLAVIEAFDTVSNSDEPVLDSDPRLTFIIVGGGLTGTELAAEMVDFCKELAKHYRIERKAYRIVLLDSGEHILSQLSPTDGEYVRQELRYSGVRIFTKTFIERVEANAVYIKGNKMIHSNVICWTGGIKAPPILEESGFDVGPSGRIPVDAYLRSPQYQNVFAIGDNALIKDRRNGSIIPQTGQYAERQGECVAEQLWEDDCGIKPHRYVPFSMGMAVSLGRDEALALSGPIRLTGIPGRLAKNASYDNYEWTIRRRPRLLTTR
ncbi:MAG: NAD(P)/FAD-dependent oxidoreductase [Chloroflexota bacterium]|nr:NAD(P)/FAD-dependent oxidoreductase [Chloroflexota bacterium]